MSTKDTSNHPILALLDHQSNSTVNLQALSALGMSIRIKIFKISDAKNILYSIILIIIQSKNIKRINSNQISQHYHALAWCDFGNTDSRPFWVIFPSLHRFDLGARTDDPFSRGHIVTFMEAHGISLCSINHQIAAIRHRLLIDFFDTAIGSHICVPLTMYRP